MNQKHCRGCPHLDLNEMSDEMYCKLKDYEQIRLRWHKHRPDWCPLVTVRRRGEPMSDLISRRAAIEAIGKVADELYENIKKGATFPQRQWFDGMAHAQSILEDLPSIQPERKKGKWLTSDDMYETGICSVCGHDFQEPVSYMITMCKYCPNCGADMRGEEG